MWSSTAKKGVVPGMWRNLAEDVAVGERTGDANAFRS